MCMTVCVCVCVCLRHCIIGYLLIQLHYVNKHIGSQYGTINEQRQYLLYISFKAASDADALSYTVTLWKHLHEFYVYKHTRLLEALFMFLKVTGIQTDASL